MSERYPLTREKASYAKFLVIKKGWPMTKVALLLKLNVGSVSRAVHGQRHPEVPPIDPDTAPNQ